MRIIGGSMKGVRLMAPKNLPVRPTTDLAKESLFNILNNRFHFDEINALDLFAGTGNISFELASRGCTSIISVDQYGGCLLYIKEIAKQYSLNIKTVKADVFKYLKMDKSQYDLIFADPPYDHKHFDDIPALVFEQGLLKEDGVLIVEHPSHIRLNNHPRFTDSRKYGGTTFSFFEQNQAEPAIR